MLLRVIVFIILLKKMKLIIMFGWIQNVLTSGLFVGVNGLLVDYNPNKR